MAPAIPVQCSNCGAETIGPYCHHCGQEGEGRLTFPTVAASVKSQFAELDFALLRTLKGLTLHPGRVAREYVAGRRRVYTNPFKYAFLTATLYALLMSFVKVDPRSQGGMQFATGIAPFLPYFMFLLLIPMAALQRWVLRRDSSYNTVECYVFLIFVFGQVFLVTTLIVLAGIYETQVGQRLASGLRIGVLTWGLTEFHRIKSYIALLIAFMISAAGDLLLIALGIVLESLGRNVLTG